MSVHEGDPLLSKYSSTHVYSQTDYGYMTLQEPESKGIKFAATKILRYDNDAAGTLGILFGVAGTIFENRRCWRTCAWYWVITIAFATFVVLDRQDGTIHLEPLKDLTQKSAFDSLTNYLTALVAFMLSLFVSSMISRWWDMRTHLNKLFNFIHDLMSRIAVRMEPEDKKYRERMLRYCLLSHRLIYAQASHKESKEDLQYFVEVGMMSPGELEALVDKPAKPLIVWMWINCLFNKLLKEGKLQDMSPPVVARFDDLFGGASGAISAIFAYLDTQIPYSYVHVLTLVVVVNNVLIAIQSGILIGEAVGPKGVPDNTVVAIEVVEVLLVPFMYHAFLFMGFELANPFGRYMIDFPGRTYGILLRDTEIACMDAIGNLPVDVFEGFRDSQAV